METATAGKLVNLKVIQIQPTPIVLLALKDIFETQQVETFTLWNEGDSNWVARSLNVSLLRDALVNKLTVILYHDDTSAIVHSVVVESQ